MIRAYNENDQEDLLKIFDLNTPKYFDPKERADFEAYLNINHKTYLTIESKGEIIGGTGYQITDENTIGRITWIFFHPNHYGKGLGKYSVEHCLVILKSNNSLQKIVVTTSQYAYQFFEKFGFILINTVDDYWGKGFDLYTMEMQLNT